VPVGATAPFSSGVVDHVGTSRSRYRWTAAGAVTRDPGVPASESFRGPTQVYTCGQNSYGELAHGDMLQRRAFVQVKALNKSQVVSIGAGNEHTVFVTRAGKVLVTGYNDNGQCGLGSTAQVRQPTEVPLLAGEDIVRAYVYNGCEHTVVLGRDGRLFSFGYNYRGQLGLGSTTSECVPRQVRALGARRVVQVWTRPRNVGRCALPRHYPSFTALMLT
jgi:RCC1 and BTB domain-containing protein